MSIVSGTIGAINQRKSAKEAAGTMAAGLSASMEMFEKAQIEREKAVADLEKIGVPTAEAQRIVLETPEFVGLQDMILQGPSSYEDIQLDPEILEAQKTSLRDLEEIAKTGITSAERAQQRIVSRSVSGQSEAQDQAILQNMRERGMSGSGAELATRLNSQQNQASRGADESLKIQAEARNRALQGSQALGGFANQLRNQQYGEQAQAAGASDSIDKFNIGLQQAHLDKIQAYKDAAVNSGNQQQMLDAQAKQQEFENKMTKGVAKTTARTGVAGGLEQAGSQIQKGATAAGQGQLDAGAANANLMGSIGSSNATLGAGLAGAYMKYGTSDKNAKKNINDGGKSIKTMLDKMEPYEFNYKDTEKDGEGRRSGVLAQDLEKSDLGLEHVVEDETGVKMIDNQKMQSTILASQAHLNNEMNDTNSRLDQLEKMLKQSQGLRGETPAPMPAPTPSAKPAYAHGGYHASDGAGNIVDTGMGMYSGDEVNSKINDNEMIINVAQQDAECRERGMGSMLIEKKKGKGRVDERLAKGELEIDENKQMKLLRDIRNKAKKYNNSEMGGLSKKEKLAKKLKTRNRMLKRGRK